MKLGYSIIYVEDVCEILNFYERAFDLEIKMKYEENGIVDYGEMQTEGAVLGFASHDMATTLFKGDYQKPDPKKKPYGQEIVFVSDDVTHVYNKAVEQGAIPLSPPTEKPWGQTICHVRSIEGTLIEICSPLD